jgi:ribonuclease P protein component
VDLVWAVNEAGYPRLGLIVPKFQSTAVARNRLRRRLKEIWRRRLRGEVGPLDVVIRARREAYGAGFDQLRDELLSWATRQQSGAG